MVESSPKALGTNRYTVIVMKRIFKMYRIAYILFKKRNVTSTLKDYKFFLGITLLRFDHICNISVVMYEKKKKKKILPT